MSAIPKYLTGILVLALTWAPFAWGADSQPSSLADFYEDLDGGADEQAALAGQEIFDRIARIYRADAGFEALKSKMIAADFLAKQMVAQLKKATGRQIFAVAGELFEDKSNPKKQDSLSMPPAKSFYETSLAIFTKPVDIGQIKDEERMFLAKFYDLKLRILTSRIAQAGQALAIAEPSFQGTYDYVLVLPLLHASETRPVNIDVLPKWMRQSSQLNVFADSCLLHYGFAYHAEAFAQSAAEQERKEFSPEDFYRSAAKRCAQPLPRVAVDCLKRALDLLDPEKTDGQMALQFEIVEIWLNFENFTLAAGEAKSIADHFADDPQSGHALWLHFYALSRANNVRAVLASIDTAIAEPRCVAYKPKLLYMKWWALRRQKDQTAQLAALEHQLITDYGNDAIIAPILLSQATDLLARQDYGQALAVLEQVQERFPSTAAAGQAQKIADKLKSLQMSP